ncbi:MAG: hypothetical protein HUJ56_03090 [Erysipelotrichaceae bacterium]|nr:hypothetical protein [Erysipelotrichaceae bacterium]
MMTVFFGLLNRIISVGVLAVLLINWPRAKAALFNKGLKTRLSWKLLIILIPIEIFNVGLLFFSRDFYDFVRVIIVTLFLVELACIKEGFTDEGVIASGKVIPYEEVRCYDIYTEKDATKVLVGVPVKDEKTKHVNIDYTLMTFDLGKEEEIKDLLKEKLPRKWQRLKKG